MEAEEKKAECNRLMQNIHSCLCDILDKFISLSKIDKKDFITIMNAVKENYTSIISNEQFKTLKLGDVELSLKVRHSIAHQRKISTNLLNSGIDALKRCQLAFGIKSPVVPLRVLACRRCKQVVTRTAQPTVRFTDLAGNRQLVTRAADVQVYMVANDCKDGVSRENTWYPGWVWSYVFCGGCRANGVLTRIGFRFDWAPEDRVDLNVCKVRYDRDRQAMVVEQSDGSIKDLTHVVSDGIIRRHNYVFFNGRLLECDDSGKSKIEVISEGENE